MSDNAAASEPQSPSAEQLDEIVEGLDGDSLNGLVQGLDTESVALVVGTIPDETLAEALNGDLREMIIPEVFRRMPERLNAPSASAVEAAIEWRITRDGGDPDHYIVVIDKGTCRLEESFEGVPRVTLEMGPVEFLKLVTGNRNPVEMFMAGKLRVQGDVMFAAQVPALFRIPKSQAG